jgi:acyl carrier protein
MRHWSSEPPREAIEMTSHDDAKVVWDLLWSSLDGGNYDLPALQARMGEDVDFVSEMGIDSLDLVEFYLRLREHFNLDLNEYDYPKLTSLRAVMELLAARPPTSAPSQTG